MSSRLSSYSATKIDSILQRELEQFGDYDSIDTLRRKERQEMTINKSIPSSTPYHRVFPSQDNNEIKIIDSTKARDEEVESYKKVILELRSKILELEDKCKGMDASQTSRSQASKTTHYKSSSVYENPIKTFRGELSFGDRDLTRSSLKSKKRGISSAAKSKNRSKYLSSDSEESISDSDDFELEISKYKRMTKENSEKKKAKKDHVKERKKLKLEIKELTREYDDDKACLIKERVKGQELADRIRKTNRELERMELKLIKASKIEGDFKRLFDSYQKSENLREHQTALIRHLKSQVHHPSKIKKSSKK